MFPTNVHCWQERRGFPRQPMASGSCPTVCHAVGKPSRKALSLSSISLIQQTFTREYSRHWGHISTSFLDHFKPLPYRWHGNKTSSHKGAHVFVSLDYNDQKSFLSVNVSWLPCIFYPLVLVLPQRMGQLLSQWQASFSQILLFLLL